MNHPQRPAPTRRSRIVSAVAVMATALLITACGGDGSAGAGPPDGDHLLVEGQGPDGALTLDDDAPVTLTIDGEQWRGTAACNTYAGTVIADGTQLELREVQVTEMGCIPDELMEIERAYLDAFLTVDRYELEGGSLVLRGPETTLVFRPRSLDTNAESDPADQ